MSVSHQSRRNNRAQVVASKVQVTISWLVLLFVLITDGHDTCSRLLEMSPVLGHPIVRVGTTSTWYYLVGACDN